MLENTPDQHVHQLSAPELESTVQATSIVLYHVRTSTTACSAAGGERIEFVNQGRRSLDENPEMIGLVVNDKVVTMRAQIPAKYERDVAADSTVFLVIEWTEFPCQQSKWCPLRQGDDWTLFAETVSGVQIPVPYRAGLYRADAVGMLECGYLNSLSISRERLMRFGRTNAREDVCHFPC